MYLELAELTHGAYCLHFKTLFGREPRSFPTTPMSSLGPRHWVRNNKIPNDILPVKETGVTPCWINSKSEKGE